MPEFTKPDGNVTVVPGVYLKQIVERYGALPLDQFLVPVVIGRGDYVETFYDVEGSREAHETMTPWLYVGNASTAASKFGQGSEIAEAMANAAKHGFSSAYVVVANPVTRASIIAQTATPTKQFKLSARKWGTPGGYCKVAWDGTTLTLTGVKRFWKVEADIAAAATRLYVDHLIGISPGMSLVLGDNNSTVETVEVYSSGEYIKSDGQRGFYIDLVAGTSGAFTTSQYALLVEYDTAETAVVSEDFSTCEEMIEWIRSTSKVFTATKDAAFTNAYPANLAESLVKEIAATWVTPVVGTSPAAGTSNHQDVIALFYGPGLERFHADTALMPSLFLLLEQDEDIHALWAQFTLDRRAFGFPAYAISGPDWDETDLGGGSAPSDPRARARAIDNQSFVLCSPGWDRRPPYLTAAPALWAMLAAGGVGHNVVNDAFKFTLPEKNWDEVNLGELTTAIRGGVCTLMYQFRRNKGYVVAEGCSTLRSNALAWNEDTYDTPLIHQRILADAIERATADTLAFFVGLDEVDLVQVAAKVSATGAQLEERLAWVEPGTFEITSLTEDGDAGFNLQWRARPRRARNFIGSTFTVIAGEEE